MGSWVLQVNLDVYLTWHGILLPAGMAEVIHSAHVSSAIRMEAVEFIPASTRRVTEAVPIGT